MIHSITTGDKSFVWVTLGSSLEMFFIFSVITPHQTILPAETDHCADGKHGCEHDFMNTEDSCVCKCREGYTLRPDGKTCQSESK